MSAKRVVAFLGAILVVAVVAGFLSHKLQPAPSDVPAEIANAQENPQVITNDVHSIYGDMNANISETIQGSGNKIYTITSQNVKEGEDKVTVFETAVPADVKFTLPPNTWSPDSDYLIVNQDTSSGSSTLVFRADGQNFGNGEKSINATEIFAQKQPTFDLMYISGWDSPTLLATRAKDEAGKVAKFWIEIPSGAVIRLAR